MVLVGCGKAPKNYSPLVPENTFATVAYNEEALVDSSFLQFLISEQQRYNKALAKVLKEDGCSDELLEPLLSSEFYDTYTRALEESDCKWALLTIAKPDFSNIVLGESKELAVPASAFVAFYENDKSLDELCAHVKERFKEHTAAFTNDAAFNEKFDEFFKKNINLLDTNVAGCKVKVMQLLDKEFSKKVKAFEPCVGVFDKRLIIIASSQKTFADTVALYRGELVAMPADSQEVKNATLSGKIISSSNFYNIDKIIQEITKDEPIPDEQLARYLSSLQTFGLGVSFDEDKGVITYSLGARFSKEGLAQELAALAQIGMGTLTFFSSGIIMQRPSLSFLTEVIAGIKPAAKDNAFAIEMSISRSMLEKLDYEKIIRENKESLCKLPCRKKCKKIGDKE